MGLTRRMPVEWMLKCIFNQTKKNQKNLGHAVPHPCAITPAGLYAMLATRNACARVVHVPVSVHLVIYPSAAEALPRLHSSTAKTTTGVFSQRLTGFANAPSRPGQRQPALRRGACSRARAAVALRWHCRPSRRMRAAAATTVPGPWLRPPPAPPLRGRQPTDRSPGRNLAEGRASRLPQTDASRPVACHLILPRI